MREKKRKEDITSKGTVRPKDRQQLPRNFLQGHRTWVAPIRGIEHQIDYIVEVTLPNKVVYRAGPEESKEIQ
ncbi:hypothetical protein CR513_13682, partial [Mucuna pruriens]